MLDKLASLSLFLVYIQIFSVKIMKKSTPTYLATAFVAVIIAFACSLSSCSDKKKREWKPEMAIQQPEMKLDSQDSIKVLTMVRDYLENIKNGNFDDAIKMMYYLNKDNKIEQLPASLAKQERKAISAFKVYAYRIETLRFLKETDCKVSYYLILQDPEQCKKEGKKPAEMGALIRPIRENGKWYLTLANSATEFKNSKIK